MHTSPMDISFLIQLIVFLCVIGLLCWCVQRIPGIPAPIPQVIQVVIVLIFALWLLGSVGMFSGHCGHFLSGG